MNKGSCSTRKLNTNKTTMVILAMINTWVEGDLCSYAKDLQKYFGIQTMIAGQILLKGVFIHHTSF